MASSDYGGYSYMNGILDLNRCDAQYRNETYHALVGNDEIAVGLYKQLHASIYIKDIYFSMSYNDILNISDGEILSASLYFKGAKITIIREHFDNYYQYVELLLFKDKENKNYFHEPDEIESYYHGFSGYGVGKGLEDAGYGYNTNEIEKRLFNYFDILKGDRK